MQLSVIIYMVTNLDTPINGSDGSTADSRTIVEIYNQEKSTESSNDPDLDHDDEPIVNLTSVTDLIYIDHLTISIIQTGLIQ